MTGIRPSPFQPILHINLYQVLDERLHCGIFQEKLYPDAFIASTLFFRKLDPSLGWIFLIEFFLGHIRAKILPGGDRIYCKEWLDDFIGDLPDAVVNFTGTFRPTAYNPSKSDLSSNPRK